MKMMRDMEEQGNWTFVYLGANHDAWAVAQKYGFQRGNTMSTISTKQGVVASYSVLARSTRKYAGSSVMNTNNFVSYHQQVEVEPTK